MNLTYKTKLIDLVKENPDLWKITKKAPNLKQKLWNNVGSKLGTTGFDARRQWEILRDQFRREYKRFIHNTNYKSKWIFYHRMLFVRDAIRTKDGRPAYQNNSDNDGNGSEGRQTEQMADEKWSIQAQLERLPKIQVRHDLHGGRTGTPLDLEGEPSTSVGVSSSCQRPDYDEVKPSPMRRMKRRFSDDVEDEDYHFVMSILPSMRSLQQIKKLRVRSKIMELIAEELDADSESSQGAPVIHPRLSMSSEPEQKFVPDEPLH